MIIIADEQSICREGLVALLSRSGSEGEIAEADRFSAVLDALSPGGAIELAIIDWNLPGLGEIAGIRQIRADYPATRIMVTLPSLRRDLVVECLRVGAHGCIAKSQSAAEVVEALATIRSDRIYVPLVVSDEAAVECSSDGPKLLSDRQRQVLQVLARGKSNKEIARELGIAEGTVKVHVNAAFRTLGVHNRVSAAAALQKIQESFDASQSGLPHPSRRAGDHRQPAPGKD